MIFDLKSSSAGDKVPLDRINERRAKSTSVGIRGREEVIVKIFADGGMRVRIKNRNEAMKRMLRER